MIVRSKRDWFVILDTNETGNLVSKTGILMKLTKSLVTIASILWTRCSIKEIDMRTFALMLPPVLVCICSHFDGPPPLPPKCERNNWMSPTEEDICRFSAEIISLENFEKSILCEVSFSIRYQRPNLRWSFSTKMVNKNATLLK